VAKFVFGMNVSLDGYVDHDRFAPDPPLFQHWIERVAGIAGSLYGRHVYELMRYWDEDQSGWGAAEHGFTAAWRAQPKWVVSRSLTGVGPNATLIRGDIEAEIRALKARVEGEIDVSGPNLAGHLSDLGLIDEFRLYLHPVVFGPGPPFFAGPRRPLRLIGSDRIGDTVIRLSYVPA